MSEEQAAKSDTGIRRLVAPPTIARARYRPPIPVEADPEALKEQPFVGGHKDADEKKLQEVWVVRSGVFRLPEDKEEYDRVWQMICDGLAKLSHDEVNWDANNGRYVALLRWAEIRCRLPGDTSPGR